MRVAVHLPQLDPSAGGGYTFAGSMLRGLAGLLDKTRHDFVIYTESGPASLPEHPRLAHAYMPRGLPARAQARFFALLNACQDRCLQRRPFPMRAPFERSLRARDVDFVWFATSAFVECGLPYLYTVWDLQHVLQPWFPEVSRDGEWEARQRTFSDAILRASAVVTPNRAGAAELQRAFPIPDNRVLQLPHPTPAFALSPRSASHDAPFAKHAVRQPFLFYPAQFWAHKDHVTALETLKCLRDNGFDFSLVLSGSDQGNERFVRQRAVDLGVLQHVHFLGFVSMEELRALYQEAFALLYVSLFGPENLPPLEAFGLGCPVIAAKVPGAEEQLGDAALLVEPMDPQGCADAVVRLQAEAGLRDSLIVRGRARAARFREEDYVAGILRYLDRFDQIRQRWSAP